MHNECRIVFLDVIEHKKKKKNLTVYLKATERGYIEEQTQDKTLQVLLDFALNCKICAEANLLNNKYNKIVAASHRWSFYFFDFFCKIWIYLFTLTQF